MARLWCSRLLFYFLQLLLPLYIPNICSSKTAPSRPPAFSKYYLASNNNNKYNDFIVSCSCSLSSDFNFCFIATSSSRVTVESSPWPLLLLRDWNIYYYSLESNATFFIRFPCFEKRLTDRKWFILRHCGRFSNLNVYFSVVLVSFPVR